MSQDEAELARKLGFLEATSIGLGTMIGGGIFILPSIAAARAGPASVLSFALAGAISLLAALSHAEIATDMPEAGGGYHYVNEALGPLWGSIVGWGMWIGLMFASAFYAVGFARYLTFFRDVPIGATAATLAVALVAINYYGAAEAGALQDLIVAALLALLAVFVGAGLFDVDPETIRPFNPEGWSAVIATTGTVYVALIGFGLVATAAGEIRNPGRNVPLSMITAVVVPTILYVFVMIVATGVLPIDRLSGSRVPVADVAREYLGWIGAFAMVIGAVLATVSSANASIFSAGRVSLAMSEDRVLTDWFHRTHGRFGTPHRSIALTGVGIVALSVLRVGIDVLAEVASFVFLVSYGLVHVALLRLRRRDDYDPDFRIPDRLYPHVPAIGVVSIVGVVTQMQLLVVAGGIALVVAGIGWYVWYVRGRR